jgi:hypothetical protein
MSGTSAGWWKRREATPKQYLMARVKKNEDGCWMWTGARKPEGYGVSSFVGRITSAHRLSYEIFFGPTKLCVLHKCDVPGCVNPSHLYAGTSRDNTRDFYQRNLKAMQIRKDVGKQNSRKMAAYWKLLSPSVKKARINNWWGGTKKFNHRRRKILNERNRLIFKMKGDGVIQCEIARKMEISSSLVSAILNGHR